MIHISVTYKISDSLVRIYNFRRASRMLEDVIAADIVYNSSIQYDKLLWERETFSAER